MGDNKVNIFKKKEHAISIPDESTFRNDVYSFLSEVQDENGSRYIVARFKLVNAVLLGMCYDRYTTGHKERRSLYRTSNNNYVYIDRNMDGTVGVGKVHPSLVIYELYLCHAFHLTDEGKKILEDNVTEI